MSIRAPFLSLEWFSFSKCSNILLSLFKQVIKKLIIFILSSTVQITAFIFGIVIGFTGPNLELFKSENSPLKSGPITADEESWISSLSAFGAIGFVLVFGWISERFGRKTAILSIGVPQTVS